MKNNKGTLANCSECGELFVKTNRTICRKCFLKDYKELISLCNFMDKHPDLSIEAVLDRTKISEARFNKLVTYGKFRAYKNVEVNCRLCNKPIHASSGKMICYSCFTSLSVFTSSSKKIESLRNNLRSKEYRLKEFEKTNKFDLTYPKKYGFKNNLRDLFGKYVNSNEAEDLPPICKCPPRLSSPYGFSRTATV